jgi:hypothetical protein
MVSRRTPMTNTKLTSEIARTAAGLLHQRGIGPFTAIELLAGGRNNRAFRVEGAGGPWLLKHYFQGAPGSRDRRASEWDWSTFCWQLGIQSLPEPLATDPLHHASLFEFIDGSHLEREDVAEKYVEQAARFVTEVNQHRNQPPALELPDAAEACFSLEEHLLCVERRVERLMTLPVNSTNEAELKEWLRKDLVQVWNEIATSLKDKFTIDAFRNPLPMASRCLSPSDFGFHNALLTSDGQLRFLDFEYAGWDDPAKLVCDFYWQQQRPVPRDTRQTLVRAFANHGPEIELEERIELLFPVYGIKWCCLVLNEFVAEDRRRREFAQSTPLDDRRRMEQLETARHLLETVRSATGSSGSAVKHFFE